MKSVEYPENIGGWIHDNVSCFRVWAPLMDSVDLRIGDETIPMSREGEYFHVEVDGDLTGSEYFLITGKGNKPDPASRYLPEGIDGPSMLVNTGSYKWKCEQWKGIPLKEMVIYELHLGTFTDSGKIMDAESRIDHLRDLGINTIELMPLSQTYGRRNWGYDGVFPFSVNNNYGSVHDLMHFIDKCHSEDMAVILDVVYNHLGPLGNVLPDFGPYVSDRYVTPWGRSLNFDSSYSQGVREYFFNNLIYWLRDIRFDGLRLDSVHNIFDRSPENFLAHLSRLSSRISKEQRRKIVLIAESDENNVSLVQAIGSCGNGFDAMWCDDFHHAIHSYLTGERQGYYSDYGRFDQIGKALKDGFVYDGSYSSYLHRIRGTKFNLEPWKLVVFAQNHDQIGNRPLGDRLISIIGEKKTRMVAAAVVLSPFTPMIFMGEESGCRSPFLFFVDPPDEVFGKKIDSGRKKEFSDFSWPDEIPFPSSVDTFMRSKLQWSENDDSRHFYLLYHDLIRARRKFLKPSVRMHRQVYSKDGIIKVTYGENQYLLFLNLGSETHKIHGKVIINTNSPRYGGESHDHDLDPYSAVFSVS